MTSSQERKAKNEAMLVNLGVPVNYHLPLVEDESEVRLRSAEEVASRCGILYALAAIGHGSGATEMLQWVQNEGLWESTSQKERQLFQNPEPSEESKIAATWEVEKLNVLLWSLGQFDELGLPRQLCDVSRIQRVLPSLDPKHTDPHGRWRDFIQSAVLRSADEILDEMDLIYRIDWAVVECRIHNQPSPAGFEPGVVYEWHYALNWLTYYADDWDDITCDT